MPRMVSESYPRSEATGAPGPGTTATPAGDRVPDRFRPLSIRQSYSASIPPAKGVGTIGLPQCTYPPSRPPGLLNLTTET